ncbi:MAG: MarR family winged helix-turn-helix transcriptional regulator [Dehalococcoidales bacterium]|nr:MarR family winged helix-turn-helix transcriptional regulator [Dehalococcoidales bacterium]
MFDLKIADPVIHTYVLLLNAPDVVSRYTEVQLSAAGITPTQFRVLVALRSSQIPPSLTELERRLFRKKKGLTTVIDDMEHAGLIKKERDATDGRAIRLEATEKDSEVFESVRLPSRELVYRIMSCFNHEDMEQLSRLLDKVRILTLQELERGNGHDTVVNANGLRNLKKTNRNGHAKRLALAV